MWSKIIRKTFLEVNRKVECEIKQSVFFWSEISSLFLDEKFELKWSYKTFLEVKKMWRETKHFWSEKMWAENNLSWSETKILMWTKISLFLAWELKKEAKLISFGFISLWSEIFL